MTCTFQLATMTIDNSWSWRLSASLRLYRRKSLCCRWGRLHSPSVLPTALLGRQEDGSGALNHSGACLCHQGHIGLVLVLFFGALGRNSNKKKLKHKIIILFNQNMAAWKKKPHSGCRFFFCSISQAFCRTCRFMQVIPSFFSLTVDFIYSSSFYFEPPASGWIILYFILLSWIPHLIRN